MKKCVPLHPQFRKMVAIDKFGAVVQLVRIPACHAGGRGFESLPHRKQLFYIPGGAAFLCFLTPFRSHCDHICDHLTFGVATNSKSPFLHIS